MTIFSAAQFGFEHYERCSALCAYTAMLLLERFLAAGAMSPGQLVQGLEAGVCHTLTP